MQPYDNDTPVFNRYRRFGLVALFVTMLITAGLLTLFRDWDYVFIWLIAINVAALFVFRYDSAIEPTGNTRVPQVVLLALTLLGGFIGAVFVYPPLWQRTEERTTFRLAFWSCAIASAILVAIYYLVICPGCR